MEYQNSSNHELASPSLILCSPSINTALEERASDWDAEEEKFCMADAAESSEQHDPSISQPNPGPAVTLSQLPAQQHLDAVEGIQANAGAMTYNTVNGSVDGAYRGGTRSKTRNDIGQVLAAGVSNVLKSKQGPVFILFNIDDELPAQYRLATVEDVEANQRALVEAMPSWEIANLANGSVDGAYYGCHIRLRTRNDVGHVLATFISRGRPGPRGGNDMIIRLIHRGL